MKSWGLWLLLLGAGSFILPLMGLQFRLLSLFGSARPVVAIVMMVLGAGMLFLGNKQQA